MQEVTPDVALATIDYRPRTTGRNAHARRADHHLLHRWRRPQQVRLLTVKVDRLREWFRPGLLMIGDAAHAMSPIGGVGINLAIQDAVATANLLSEPLYEKRVSVEHLAQIQKRRELPTRIVQAVQVLVQNRVVNRVLGLRSKPKVPAVVRLLDAVPLLQCIPARLVGIGFRPEHVRSADRSLGR